MRRCADSVTSSTARLKAASFAREGLLVPLSLRTNCSAEARISSSVAGGAKLASVLMLRHMVASHEMRMRDRVGESNKLAGGNATPHRFSGLPGFIERLHAHAR